MNFININNRTIINNNTFIYVIMKYMSIKVSILSLIKEKMNLLVCESIQFQKIHKKSPKNLEKFMILLVKDIADGNIKSAHLSQCKAKNLLSFVDKFE